MRNRNVFDLPMVVLILISIIVVILAIVPKSRTEMIGIISGREHTKTCNEGSCTDHYSVTLVEDGKSSDISVGYSDYDKAVGVCLMDVTTAMLGNKYGDIISCRE